MTPELLHELAGVVRCDADALLDPYAWPPKTPTDEERREADRLFVLAKRITYRANVAAYEAG